MLRLLPSAGVYLKHTVSVLPCSPGESLDQERGDEAG